MSERERGTYSQVGRVGIEHQGSCWFNAIFSIPLYLVSFQNIVGLISQGLNEDRDLITLFFFRAGFCMCLVEPHLWCRN